MSAKEAILSFIGFACSAAVFTLCFTAFVHKETTISKDGRTTITITKSGWPTPHSTTTEKRTETDNPVFVMTKTETTEESHFFSWSVLIFWIGVVFGFLTLIFLGGVLAGLKGAIFKKSASELESELLDAERAHQDKVETGAACPKCGFAFGWNGAECSHCNYFDSAGS